MAILTLSPLTRIRDMLLPNAVLCLHVLIMPRTFYSESTLYSCLNVKKILAQNRRDI